MEVKYEIKYSGFCYCTDSCGGDSVYRLRVIQLMLPRKKSSTQFRSATRRAELLLEKRKSDEFNLKREVEIWIKKKTRFAVCKSRNRMPPGNPIIRDEPFIFARLCASSNLTRIRRGLLQNRKFSNKGR